MVIYELYEGGNIMKAKAQKYTAHKDYDVELDLEILNTKIRIIDSDFDNTGTVYYEGTVCKFIKERIPAEFLVAILASLKHQDEITYKLAGSENIIQKIK